MRSSFASAAWPVRRSSRNLTKSRATKTLITTACSLFKMVAAMIAPCSVKATGGVLLPPQLENAFCNFKFVTSCPVRRYAKSEGNLRLLRRYCCISRCVVTSIDGCEVCIENYPLTTHYVDKLFDRELRDFFAWHVQYRRRKTENTLAKIRIVREWGIRRPDCPDVWNTASPGYSTSQHRARPICIKTHEGWSITVSPSALS